MRITIKRIVAALIAVFIAVSAAVGVNAAYVDMLDYGLMYFSGGLKVLSGAGATASNAKQIYAFWALDSFDQDYTYTFRFRFTADKDLKFSTNLNYTDIISSQVFVLDYKIAYIPNGLTYLDVFSTVEKSDDYYEIIVKLNPGLIDWTSFPMYVYFSCSLNTATTFTTNGWGVSAEYDPGGNNLRDLLEQIVNAGSGYPVPDSAASSLDSSVSSIDSAESALTGKSSSLMESVASEWTANKGTAKTFLATIKPTAVEIKNVYTTLTNAMPDEVLALFAIIPLLLFIGFLIGRVK